MQERENNFETIINTWRRLSGELERQPTTSMPGDSSDIHQHKKNEEPTDLLPADRLRAPAVSTAGVGLVATAEALDTANEEKQEFLHREETKEAAGDTNENVNNDDDDYLENDENVDKKSPVTKNEKDALSDKVDSVYLRRAPPGKARSTATSVPEEEGCGMKCLYFTLQCCDCVLM